MKQMTSNKPYLIRAIYDWIVDNGLTPYLLVTVEHGGIDVPMEYVNDGKIVFNISPASCRGLHIENDRIVFTARFGGVAIQNFIVPQAVLCIYANENGQGMEFPEEKGTFELPLKESFKSKLRAKPSLSLVKPLEKEDE
jgi:stringent starvation protein B